MDDQQVANPTLHLPPLQSETAAGRSGLVLSYLSLTLATSAWINEWSWFLDPAFWFQFLNMIRLLFQGQFSITCFSQSALPELQDSSAATEAGSQLQLLWQSQAARECS
ncbi:hypothetical protein HispidOSU_006844 [Sigmodon hispidus]